MRYLPRKTLYLLVAGILLMGILSDMFPIASVRADVGVQPVLPGGSSIKPGEETPIQMAAEVVTMNVRQATEADNALVKLNPQSYGYDLHPVWYPAVAEVTADFTMRNPTDVEVSLTGWFPLASALEHADWNFNPGEIVPTIESFQISVGGNPLEYTVSDLPNPQGEDKPPLPWASFPLTFPANEDTLIQVSYMVPLHPAPKEPVVTLYYVFQTGASWAGPIGKAELIVNLPFPASDGTLSGITSGNLYLPNLSVPGKKIDLPAGAVLKGKQARWTWKNFEPQPKDDFAIYVLKPEVWQALESARKAVQAHAQDGQAWLNLADRYYSLSFSRTFRPMLFNSAYLQPCAEAFKKAVELLPDHPVPHLGQALLALAPYMNGRNAPADVMQYVQDQVQMAKDLRDQNSSFANDGLVNAYFNYLDEAFFSYFYNDATATSDRATLEVYFATSTAEATIQYLTRTVWAIDKATSLACWKATGKMCTATFTPTETLIPTLTSTVTPSPKPSFTATHLPSSTPQPPSATSLVSTSTVIQEAGVPGTIIIGAVLVIILVVAGYLFMKNLRQGTS